MLNNLGKYDVVLGSNSPRRRELLNDMGVNFRVEAIKGIDENYPANLPVEEIPVYLARIKAQGHPLQENELLITAVPRRFPTRALSALPNSPMRK